MKKHTENRLEDAIVDSLASSSGYVLGRSEDFSAERALEPGRVLEFLKSTQPKAVQSLQSIHGDQTDTVILESLCAEIEIKGVLKVLREGFKCYGRKLFMAYFAPSNHMNSELLDLYQKNILSVTHQLFFEATHEKSLDIVLFLNGIPLVTAELKNPLTGQTVEDAKRQYITDRDSREPIFAFRKRTLVHFAVDPDLVFMTTRLDGDRTVFLPFNQGCDHGAGNPPPKDGAYRTSYLWREIWQRDSLLDIIGRYMHLQVTDKRIVTDKGIKKIHQETMIFPRYHQLDAVRKLLAHVKTHGAGHNYLVQHSAGSGKSNSIAWLAYRLSSLHTDQDEKIFDSVVVVTDRRVLDRQLQDTIFQFDHKSGVVQKIDENTRQLAEALASQTPIIITTLQKFPFINDAIEKINTQKGDASLTLDTRGKRFAVIVDEAHSSQSGETAMELKATLNAHGVAEAAAKYKAENDTDDSEDEIVRQMLKRGRQPNMSFFAFTATPKYKTKLLFDEPGPSGEAPFHEYTMKQAIEEKFILDVLASYTTYETYYKLVQSSGNDPKVERKQAAKTLARFLSLHPYNIRQKTEVMVEHFRSTVQHKIGGRAKAMVVTESRLHAVRYKLAFDEYIQEKGYKDIKTLVAFSGIVEDPDRVGKTYTEVGMNGIRESALPETFAGDDYKVLLVAEKYQTGFDQPLLHTMYVDKKLSGVQAVQTLSRLNRKIAGKEDTFVLDFRNTAEEIYEAFKPYYEYTAVDQLADPVHLYRLQHQIEESKIIPVEEVDAFCKVYFKPVRTESKQDHARYYEILGKAVARFVLLDEEAQDNLKGLFVSFRNLYGFLSQVIPYQDSDLEKLYTYIRFLLTLLPRRSSGKGYHFEDEVDLRFYRLQKISEGRIDLNEGKGKALKGPTDVATGEANGEMVKLSELIHILNEKFGTSFTSADQLFFDQIQAEATADEHLQQAAKANSIDNFRFVFEKTLEGLMIDRMEGNEAIFDRLMGDASFRKVASDFMLRKVYDSITGPSSPA